MNKKILLIIFFCVFSTPCFSYDINDLYELFKSSQWIEYNSDFSTGLDYGFNSLTVRAMGFIVGLLISQCTIRGFKF